MEIRTIKFRDLRADEIELRVGSTNSTGFSLLLYKTARADANILDETVGVYNWQKRFYQVKNTMICEIGLYDEERKEWVWKGDAGDESNTEAIKGEASDSFKRAGFAIGIARALYSSPFIWIKNDENNNPKTSRYSVKEIGYRDGTISKLIITNDKTGEVVFTYPKGAKVENKTKEQVDPNNIKTDLVGSIRPNEKGLIEAYLMTLDGTRSKQFFDWLDKKFNTMRVDNLTAEQGVMVVNALKLRG